MLESSVNFSRVEQISSKSEIYNTSAEPMTDPCRTSLTTSPCLDFAPFTKTCCFRPIRKSVIRDNILPLTFEEVLYVERNQMPLRNPNG